MGFNLIGGLEMKPDMFEIEVIENFDIVYRCEYCSETYDDKDAAKEHWEQDHNEEDEG